MNIGVRMNCRPTARGRMPTRGNWLVNAVFVLYSEERIVPWPFHFGLFYKRAKIQYSISDTGRGMVTRCQRLLLSPGSSVYNIFVGCTKLPMARIRLAYRKMIIDYSWGEVRSVSHSFSLYHRIQYLWPLDWFIRLHFTSIILVFLDWLWND